MHYHPTIQHKIYIIMGQECKEIFCKVVQITCIQNDQIFLVTSTGQDSNIVVI